MVYCCVIGCKTKYYQKIALRLFPPVDHPMFEQWKAATMNKDLDDMDNVLIRKKMRVCNLHFTEKYRRRTKFFAYDFPKLMRNIDSELLNTQMNMEVSVQEEVDVESLNPETNMEVSVQEEVDVDSLNPETNMEVSVQEEVDVDSLNSQMNVEVSRQEEVGNRNQTPKKKMSRMQLQRRISYYRQKTKSLKSKCRNFSKFYELDENVQAFINSQLYNQRRKTRGEHYTLEDKILGLNIFKNSPKCYKYLSQIFKMPSETTIKALNRQIKIDPGMNDIMFKILKEHLNENSVIKDKLVTVIFDEMSVTPHLEYMPSRGMLFGFEDNGFERTCRVADHAQVFMIRSVFRKWKFPISYNFSQGATKSSTIVRYIKEIVTRLTNIGYIVVALICDQGSTNCAAIKQLLEDSNRSYIKENKEPKDNIIKIGQSEIVPLFDICHLIKCMRNNLLNKNLEYIFDGESLVASWEDILTTYLIDTSMEIRILPKITPMHVYADKINKMKVVKAVQVFSRAVSGVMMVYKNGNFLCPNGKKLSSQSLGTSKLCKLMNDVFDSLNSASRVNDNLNGCATLNSNHLTFWYEARRVMKTMKFVNGTANRKIQQPPVLRNFVKTLDGFINLHNILLDKMQLQYLPTRSFNQDPLENTFGQLRQMQGPNTKPSCGLFVNRFSSFIINNVSAPNIRGTNCEADFCKPLVGDINLFINKSFEKPSLSSQKIEIPLHIKCNNIDETHENILLFNLKIDILKEIETFVIKRKCSVCNQNIYARKAISFHELEQAKSLDYYRTYCSEVLLLSMLNIFNMSQYIFPEILQERDDPYCALKYYVSQNIKFKFNVCPHKIELINFIIDKTLQTFFRTYLQTLNNILIHKLEKLPKPDTLQKSFFLYASKHK